MLLNDQEIYDAHFQMMKMLRIGTHNGTFHADEVLACALLKILPKYKVCKNILERLKKKVKLTIKCLINVQIVLKILTVHNF